MTEDVIALLAFAGERGVIAPPHCLDPRRPHLLAQFRAELAPVPALDTKGRPYSAASRFAMRDTTMPWRPR